MDLSNFTKTLNIMPEQVRYYDEVSKEDKTANEIEIIWNHIELSVSELNFFLREGHNDCECIVAAREQEILEIWMQELGYDSTYYRVENKIIVEKGKVTDQGQIDTWKKPNPETHVPAEDTDIL